MTRAASAPRRDEARGYVLATPVRNERAALPALLSAVKGQLTRPLIWVIVDDGSDDGSREWLAEATRDLPWVVLEAAPESADEYLGGHIARIKRFGMQRALELARARGHHPLCAGVLDADIELPPQHYEELLEAMARSPELGIASSLIWARQGEHLFVEPFQREDLPRGGTQFFRVECLEAIGGLPPWPSFDSISNVKARALGYETRLMTSLWAVHERETATRHGHAPGYARKGRYAWFLGLHPLLVAARTAAYSLRRPRRAGFHFLRGYLQSALSRTPRCPDPVVRSHYGLPRVIEVAKAALKVGPRYVSEADAQRPTSSSRPAGEYVGP